MDRLQWSNVSLKDDENFHHSNDGVKLYDGENKVQWINLFLLLLMMICCLLYRYSIDTIDSVGISI